MNGYYPTCPIDPVVIPDGAGKMYSAPFIDPLTNAII